MARINLINDMSGVDFREGINSNFVEVYNSITASVIKSVYESNADTNAFTDLEKQKLSDINDLPKKELLINVVGSKIVNDETVLICDSTNGDINITLPLEESGRKIYIKKVVELNNIIISALDATSLIENNIDLTMISQFESVTLVNDGINWHII